MTRGVEIKAKQHKYTMILNPNIKQKIYANQGLSTKAAGMHNTNADHLICMLFKPSSCVYSNLFLLDS